MPTISSININGEPMQLATTVQLDTYVKKDALQEIMDLGVENKNDIQDIRNVTQIHDMRLSQQDREIYDLREKVKEALAVLHHPGLIANRMLDKAESFIHTYKSVLTDKNGQTVEMIEVSKLNTMIEKLREAIKNG